MPGEEWLSWRLLLRRLRARYGSLRRRGHRPYDRWPRSAQKPRPGKGARGVYGARRMPLRSLHPSRRIPRSLLPSRKGSHPFRQRGRRLKNLASRVVGAGILVATLGGCEHGCLTTWLARQGLGGTTPGSSGREAPIEPRPVLDLSGTDCSDGLLRCVEGEVEASRVAHLPNGCGANQNPEGRLGCTCPWERVLRCGSGCVEEGLEVIAFPDAGAAQLCRPETPVARPLLATETSTTEICANEGFACVENIVRVCDQPGQPVRLVGKCLHGCQPGITLDHGETKNPNPGVLSILCRRDHAERQ